MSCERLAWWVVIASVCGSVAGSPSTAAVDAGLRTDIESRPVQEIAIRNAHLQLTLDTRDHTLSVRDLRSQHVWRQVPSSSKDSGFTLSRAEKTGTGLVLALLHGPTGLACDVTVTLDGEKPEFCVEVAAQGAMRSALRYPHAFASEKGDFLILPVNEGISYPVDDETLKPMSYHLYGGHGLCMGWYGVTDGKRGLMTIVETPDDASVQIRRADGRLYLAPEWLSQKGQFAYSRKIRYVSFADGGYVAMCKRYRQAAMEAGRLATLAEKRKTNPHVDQLIGAVNVWCWDRNALAICRELQSLGISRILWSNRASPDVIRQLNDLGILASRYDIYQDVMNPENFSKLRGVHPDWTTEAWPRDLMLDAKGDWTRGWVVHGKDGAPYPCGVLCDRQALAYAQRRISEELKTHPYRCRFIDTTTASPWRECYHPDHPMTRSESREWKMKLLKLVSDEFALITGCETGHEAAVPYVHYFEGMLSLGPYRVPDSGRRMIEPVDDPPERVARFQTGHVYRLPLWELIYHDCVVAQWYWGDYNNKLPKLWDRRDLFNALYGTPPMFMFNPEIWKKHRDRFVQSYRTVTPVARATGYSEMLSHRWLTQDHAVQRTEFANGVVVTVNFGEQPYTLEDGHTLAPLAQRVVGMAE